MGEMVILAEAMLLALEPIEKELKDGVAPLMKICSVCEEKKELCEYYIDKRLAKCMARCKKCFISKKKKIKVKAIIKICKRCGMEKSVTEFYFRKNSKGQLNSHCIDCCIKYKQEYRTVNNDKEQEKRRKTKEENKIKRALIKESNKELNKEKIELKKQHTRELGKKYREEHRDELAQYQKEYREANKEEISKDKNEYNKNRKKNDPAYKLRCYISSSIGGALRKQGSSKQGKSCLDFLPFTKEELKAYIEKQFEPWMNWENRGIYRLETWNDNDQSTWKWQLDHVIPHSDFPYTSMEDDNFQKCCALSNLRPY